jgi:8-oxo-dGTP diphosphatase
MTQPPRVGVAALVVRENRVLLLHRINAHGAGSWSPPGGHLEPGENPEQCAIRETKEETNLDIGGLRFLAITNDIFEEEGLHYITIWMRPGVVDGEAVVNAPEEASEIGWFAWDTLPENLFLPLHHLLAGESYPPGINYRK